MSLPWNGEPESAFSLSAGMSRSVGADGEATLLGFLAGHEGPDQCDPGVPLDAVGDHCVGWRSVAGEIRDLAFSAVEPPGDPIVTVAAEALC